MTENGKTLQSVASRGAFPGEIQLHPGTQESGKMKGAQVLFHSSIIGHLMVDKDRLETNLLQLFGHPEYSEWFSIIFEVNIVTEQKQE